MQIPSHKDLAPFGTLDELSVAKRWQGKALDEAAEMISENPIKYQEDLMWMGQRAFAYYIYAAKKVIETKPLDQLGDFAYGLLLGFRHRLQGEYVDQVTCKAIDQIATFIVSNAPAIWSVVPCESQEPLLIADEVLRHVRLN